MFNAIETVISQRHEFTNRAVPISTEASESLEHWGLFSWLENNRDQERLMNSVLTIGAYFLLLASFFASAFYSKVACKGRLKINGLTLFSIHLSWIAVVAVKIKSFWCKDNIIAFICKYFAKNIFHHFWCHLFTAGDHRCIIGVVYLYVWTNLSLINGRDCRYPHLDF